MNELNNKKGFLLVESANLAFLDRFRIHKKIFMSNKH